MDIIKIFSPVIQILGGKGYGHSVHFQESIDAEGNPIPWITYPAIDYLRGLDARDRRLFEFGAGNSTLFWAKLFKEVVSVEHDKKWHDKVASLLPSNCKLVFRDQESAYLDAIDEQGGMFDVIVIDGGLNRRRMAERAIPKLGTGGFAILDNSDCHVRAAKVLRDAGLIQVDMTGFSPINPFEQTTSFFFRRDFNFQPSGEWQPPKSKWGMQHYVDE
jgi:hypothetical protein